MDLLKTLPLILFATACYSPDVRDCTVACSKADDCAPSQVCGNDGFCAAPELAGTCGRIGAMLDGGAGSEPAVVLDARPPDATPDAWPTVRLRVRIEGRDIVSVIGVADCDGGSGNAECWFDVKQGVPASLVAAPKNNWRFDKWDEGCKDQPTTTCTLTANGELHAKARFASGD